MASDGYRIGHRVIVQDVRLNTDMVSILQLIKKLP